MKTGAKLATVALLAVAVAATFALRSGKRAEYVARPEPVAVQTPQAPGGSAPPASPAPGQEAASPVAAAPVRANPPAGTPPVATAARPRILELGSMRCQACLEMAKVLHALRASQGTKLRVDFIDVFEEPAAAERYNIALIPTQILFDAAGKEIFRHQGFFSHDDILATFRQLGVQL
ncbi:MAG TPA: thioredoxin family protein [bacterium]